RQPGRLLHDRPDGPGDQLHHPARHSAGTGRGAHPAAGQRGVLGRGDRPRRVPVADDLRPVRTRCAGADPRVPLPRGTGHRLLDLPRPPGEEGVGRPRRPAGQGRGRRPRRWGHHQRRHRPGRSVRSTWHAAAHGPRSARTHRRSRSPRRHDHRAHRHRAVDLRTRGQCGVVAEPGDHAPVGRGFRSHPSVGRGRPPAGREHAPAGREGARGQRIASRQALTSAFHTTSATDVIELAGRTKRAGPQRPGTAEAHRREGDSVGARRWTERTMEIGQHAIAVVLTVIACIRAVTNGAPLIAAIAVSVLFLSWYAIGAVRAARTGALVLAKWWLIVLAAAWLCTLRDSAEFIWIAFLLWLLARHLISLRIAIVFTALTYSATVVAPLPHYWQVLAPSIIGSLIGAVFALGLSRGYIELLREGRRREELLRSLELANQSLLDLQDELALTQRHAGEIQERTRVSRDIHDTIAQSISSIRLIAHAEAERTTDGHAGQVLEQVEDLAAQGSRDVRRIIAALAPTELEDGALSAAIRRLLT